jgi:hypothetical protein
LLLVPSNCLPYTCPSAALAPRNNGKKKARGCDYKVTFQPTWGHRIFIETPNLNVSGKEHLPPFSPIYSVASRDDREAILKIFFGCIRLKVMTASAIKFQGQHGPLGVVCHLYLKQTDVADQQPTFAFFAENTNGCKLYEFVLRSFARYAALKESSTLVLAFNHHADSVRGSTTTPERSSRKSSKRQSKSSTDLSDADIELLARGLYDDTMLEPLFFDGMAKHGSLEITFNEPSGTTRSILDLNYTNLFVIFKTADGSFTDRLAFIRRSFDFHSRDMSQFPRSASTSAIVSRSDGLHNQPGSPSLPASDFTPASTSTALSTQPSQFGPMWNDGSMPMNAGQGDAGQGSQARQGSIQIDPLDTSSVNFDDVPR